MPRSSSLPHAGLKGAKVREQMRSLCEAILAGKQFRDANAAIEAFLQDEDAKAQYIAYNTRRAEVRERQERGFQLTAGEIDELEKLHQEIIDQPVIRGFMVATDELERIKHAAIEFLEKSFELCRVPTDSDFEDDDE